MSKNAYDHHHHAAAFIPYSIKCQCASEFVGTYIMIFLATIVMHAKGADTLTSIVVSNGLCVVVIVASLEHISGAHINPAVSWGVALVGKLPWQHLPLYIASQFGGAMAGAYTTCLILGNERFREIHAGSCLVITTPLNAFVVEVIFTAILFLMVLGVAMDRHGAPPVAMAPVVVGFGVLGNLMTVGHNGMLSMNPFRVFCPHLTALLALGTLSDEWWYGHYIFIIGPFVGGSIGVILHKAFYAFLACHPHPSTISDSKIPPKLNGIIRDAAA